MPSEGGDFTIAGLAEVGAISMTGVPAVHTRAEGKVVITWPVQPSSATD